MRRQVLALMLAAGAAGAAEPTAPPRVEKDAYVAAISGGAEARKGVAGKVVVTVEARGGFHMNGDYPSSFKPAAAGGGAIRYPVAKVDKSSGLATAACADKPEQRCRISAEVPFVADAAGAQTVGGVVAFSVCDDEQCLIEKVALALPVVVH